MLGEDGQSRYLESSQAIGHGFEMILQHENIQSEFTVSGILEISFNLHFPCPQYTGFISAHALTPPYLASTSSLFHRTMQQYIHV